MASAAFQRDPLAPLCWLSNFSVQNVPRTRENVQLIRLGDRETVVLLMMTPSTPLSVMTEAMSISSGSLRSGAILTTSLGARIPGANLLRTAFTPSKRSVSAERVCNPLYISTS